MLRHFARQRTTECGRVVITAIVKAILGLHPGVALYFALIDEAEHIDEVIAKAAAAYGSKS
jgi:hypothetical protein